MALLNKKDVLRRLENVGTIEDLKIKIADIISENNKEVLEAIEKNAPKSTVDSLLKTQKRNGKL